MIDLTNERTVSLDIFHIPSVVTDAVLVAVVVIVVEVVVVVVLLFPKKTIICF